mmetsp:Transcript_21869/g.51870  ORF Transcript_21869/g.51870 Transcript_21869/m.51870 type:complete len:308 (-) Transcript_21869:163-1086(-)
MARSKGPAVRRPTASASEAPAGASAPSVREPARARARQPTGSASILDALDPDALDAVLAHLEEARDLAALQQTCSFFRPSPETAGLADRQLASCVLTAKRARSLAQLRSGGWWPASLEEGAVAFGGWACFLWHLEQVATSRAASIAAGRAHALLLQRWRPAAVAAADEPEPGPDVDTLAGAFCGEWREAFYGSQLTLTLGATDADGTPTLIGSYRCGAGRLEGRVSGSQLEGAWVENAGARAQQAAPASEGSEGGDPDAGCGTFKLELRREASGGEILLFSVLYFRSGKSDPVPVTFPNVSLQCDYY